MLDEYERKTPMNASADFMNALAWSLVHFLWQGAAIAALAAAFMFVFRSPRRAICSASARSR